jgi:hypothetical protein
MRAIASKLPGEVMQLPHTNVAGKATLPPCARIGRSEVCIGGTVESESARMSFWRIAKLIPGLAEGYRANSAVGRVSSPEWEHHAGERETRTPDTLRDSTAQHRVEKSLPSSETRFRSHRGSGDDLDVRHDSALHVFQQTVAGFYGSYA